MTNTIETISDEMLEQAAECLKVMSHPVRLKLVNLLLQGNFPVGELSEKCDCSPSQTCEHLRLMKSCGFLSSERDGRRVFYKVISPRLPKLLECISNTCSME
jgi:DNA-binding transcriptional ArsR family regulator